MSTPFGRPRKISEDEQGVACILALMGRSRQEIADFLHCNVSTLRRAAARDANFRTRLRDAANGNEELDLLKTVIGAALKRPHSSTARWLRKRYAPDLNFAALSPEEFDFSFLDVPTPPRPTSQREATIANILRQRKQSPCKSTSQPAARRKKLPTKSPRKRNRK